LDFS
jgi:hypothetical protein